MSNEYLVGAAQLAPHPLADQLCTGVGLPARLLWAGCDVVVLRPTSIAGPASNAGPDSRVRPASRAKFHVPLSLQELRDARNNCLWREVTAHVPFAEWDSLEVILTSQDVATGERSVQQIVQWPDLCQWLPLEEQEIDASEETVSDTLADLQYLLLDKISVPSVMLREHWTLIIRGSQSCSE